QLLHHPLDHDRRRPGRRLRYLDYPDLPARLWAAALGRGSGVFGTAFSHHDGAGLLLCPGADPWRRREERRMTNPSLATSRPATRKPIDLWRWAGRIFLTLLLIFTVV